MWPTLLFTSHMEYKDIDSKYKYKTIVWCCEKITVEIEPRVTYQKASNNWSGSMGWNNFLTFIFMGLEAFVFNGYIIILINTVGRIALFPSYLYSCQAIDRELSPRAHVC